MSAARRLGDPVPARLMFAPPGFFAPDDRAVLRATLRRRAADRAMVRRLGALKATVVSVLPESAAYRGALALNSEPAHEVAAALVEWARRNDYRGQS